MSSNGRLTALIAGGGIAGSAAAIALRHVGVEPLIFESRPQAADGLGAFLTVATNGIDALRAIGADEPVLQRAFPTPEITLRSGAGKRLGRGPTGIPLADGTCSQTLKREDLYEVLAQQATCQGAAVSYSKRLVDARPDGDRIRAFFDDGTEARGRLAEVIDRLQAPAPKVARLLEDASEELLSFYAFPREHWPKLRSTNPLERVNKEIGRRSDVVGIYPNDAALIRLAGMLLIEQNDEWLVQRRYLSDTSIRQVLSPDTVPQDNVNGATKEGVIELNAA